MLHSDFLNSLSEDETALLLHYVNNINRPLSHNFTFELSHLKAFNREVLIENLLRSFDRVSEEGHPVFTSLMQKFGVKVEINKAESPKIEEPKTEITENKQL